MKTNIIQKNGPGDRNIREREENVSSGNSNPAKRRRLSPLELPAFRLFLCGLTRRYLSDPLVRALLDANPFELVAEASEFSAETGETENDFKLIKTVFPGLMSTEVNFPTIHPEK